MVNARIDEQVKITVYDFDPDATTATEIAWVDMSQYDRIMVQFIRTVGTSALTLKLMGNTASDGSGTDVDIVTKTFAAQPNAFLDTAFLECSADDIAGVAAGNDIRYVTAVATFATGTDEGVFNYIRTSARYKASGLTSDIVA